MDNVFAGNLKRLRQEAGLTQEELGRKLDMAQRKISYLENGTIEPDIKSLIAIAAFFEVRTDYLLGLED